MLMFFDKLCLQLVKRFNGRLLGYIGYGNDKFSFSHIDDLLSKIPEIVKASKQMSQLRILVPKEQCEKTQPTEPPNSPSIILEEPRLQKGTCISELKIKVFTIP